MIKLRLAACFLAATILLGGCANSSSSEPIDPDTAAESILAAVTFRDSLVKAEDGAAESFYTIDDTITGYAIYISGSGATAEEVAVLTVDDTANLDAARAIIDKRVEDLIFRFEDYVPGEMVKLEEPVIVEGGNAIALVLADDTAAAKDAAEQAVGN
jgi:hypothetical protein